MEGVERVRRWLIGLLDRTELRELRARVSDLEDELERAREDREQEVQRALRLEDRCAAMESDRASLWRMVEVSLENERTSYKSQLNEHWQKQGYGIRYPEAPSIEKRAEPGPPQHGSGSGRMLPSQIVQMKTNAFLQQVQELAAHRAMPSVLTDPPAA